MPSAVHRILVAIAVSMLLVTLAVSTQGQGRWSANKLAPLPEPAEEYWSITANGKFYLFGGSATNIGGRQVLPGRVLEYDPATDKWTAKKQMPHPADHMALTEYRGRIYLFGGTGPQQASDGGPNNFFLEKSWEYDPVADSWKPLAPIPTKRHAAVAAEAGGKIYVIGGSGYTPGTEGPFAAANPDLIVLAVNEVYDPATNKWETRRSVSTPRNHAAIGVVGGKIYVIGGRLASANVGNFVASPTDVVEEYDPAMDRWRGMNKMPTARSGHGWATYQGRIYVVGGEHRDSHMDAVYRDVEAFDPALNEWYRLPPMPTARHGVNVAALGNRLHAIGGHVAFSATGGHASDTALHEVFEFNK